MEERLLPLLVCDDMKNFFRLTAYSCLWFKEKRDGEKYEKRAEADTEEDEVKAEYLLRAKDSMCIAMAKEILLYT